MQHAHHHLTYFLNVSHSLPYRVFLYLCLYLSVFVNLSFSCSFSFLFLYLSRPAFPCISGAEVLENCIGILVDIGITQCSRNRNSGQNKL